MDRKFRPDRLTGSLLIYSPIEINWFLPQSSPLPVGKG